MIVFWIKGEPMALKEFFNDFAQLRGGELRTAAEKAWGPKEKDKAMQWVIRPNQALGGEIPLKLAIASDEGLQQALDVIGRIEYGVYS